MENGLSFEEKGKFASKHFIKIKNGQNENSRDSKSRQVHILNGLQHFSIRSVQSLSFNVNSKPFSLNKRWLHLSFGFTT